MSGTKPPVTYWDSCVFLAWLLDEKPPNRTEEEVRGLRQAVAAFEKLEIKVVTSTLTIPEAGRKLSSESYDKLRLTLQRPGASLVSLDLRIAERARTLQAHFAAKGPKTLSLPDAIHLATAMVCRAQIFYTYDGNNDKTLGLLPLDGEIVDGHQLRIAKPPPASRNLDLDLRGGSTKAP